MTSLDTIDTTVHKTYALLGALEEQNEHITDRRHAYEVVRAVLSTLRDRITPEDAHTLGAQLTPLLRGFYYEGWSPGSTPLKMNKEEFLQTIEERIGNPYQGPIDELVREVLTAVGTSTDPLSLEKLKKSLPDKIAELVP